MRHYSDAPSPSSAGLSAPSSPAFHLEVRRSRGFLGCRHSFEQCDRRFHLLRRERCALALHSAALATATYRD